MLEALNWGPMLVVGRLAEQIGLMDILDRQWAVPQDPKVAPADRALVLLANRLTDPRSEHGLAHYKQLCDVEAAFGT